MEAQVAEDRKYAGDRMAPLLRELPEIKLRSDIPSFRPGDTVKVHGRIVEGNKERVQVFEGVVIRRKRGLLPAATFTVRKISYNIGVERTFFVHSPRIEKIEIVSRGIVRRSKLYYLRDMAGKKGRIKKDRMDSILDASATAASPADSDLSDSVTSATEEAKNSSGVTSETETTNPKKKAKKKANE